MSVVSRLVAPKVVALKTTFKSPVRGVVISRNAAAHRPVRHFTLATVIGLTLLTSGSLIADGWDPRSLASTRGSISNTRHNLTFSYSAVALSEMQLRMNIYSGVCVYCHTPHGSNSQINAPLWNRTINLGNYTIYDKPTTLMQPIGQPGPNSLTCLSCHDGTISPDAILNMPGSGRYATKAEETGWNPSFLDRWVAEFGGVGPSITGAAGHKRLRRDDLSAASCMACHSPAETVGAPDFTIFGIETDLRDDHPIGVLFPTLFGPGIDFNEPTVKIPGKMDFFDLNGNNHADPNEVRLYDTGEGSEVECASCHDPHGVPSAGAGSRFNPSFLRVNNGIGAGMNYDGNTPTTAGVTGITSDGASALCQTCHSK
jgi:mono/diheme cytochrome c family protein